MKMLKVAKERSVDGKLRCELFGTILNPKTAQVHHLRPDLYDTLEPELFKVLSPTAHDFVETAAVILSGKTPVPDREKLLAWIIEFLPVEVKSR